MIRLIRDLFASPGAEPDAEGWATRFCAHQGIAVLVAALMLTLGPWGLLLSLAGYAVWEAAQWAVAREWRTLPLWWDCVLDWCAWAAATGLVWALAGGWPVWPWLLASVAMLVAGVWRREG